MIYNKTTFFGVVWNNCQLKHRH